MTEEKSNKKKNIIPKKFSITVPAIRDSSETIHEFLQNICNELKIDEEKAFDVMVAVDEVCANIISYSYLEDDSGKIDILCFVEKGILTIDITDQGEPFDPTLHGDVQLEECLETSTIGGLGIHLLKELMDDVSYHRGNCEQTLRLTKNINAE